MMNNLANNTILNLSRTNFGNGNRFSYLNPAIAFDIYDKKNYTGNDVYAQVRLLGPTLAYHFHTCEFINKDTGVKKFYYMPCAAYKPSTGEPIEEHDCPYCKAGIKVSTRFYVNAIIRDLQDETRPKPYPRTDAEKKPVKINDVSFLIRSYTQSTDANGNPKIIYSSSFSPVRVLELPASVIWQIAEMEKVNWMTYEDGKKKLTPITDLERGCDLVISYRPNEATPAKKYAVQRTTEGKTPITKEMRRDEILLYDLSILPDINVEALKKEFIRSCSRIANITNKDYVNSLVGSEGQNMQSQVQLNQIPVSQISLNNIQSQPKDEAQWVDNTPKQAPKSNDSIDALDDDEFNDL